MFPVPNPYVYYPVLDTNINVFLESAAIHPKWYEGVWSTFTIMPMRVCVRYL